MTDDLGPNEPGPDSRLEANPALGPEGLARLRAGGPVAVVGLGTIGSRVAAALATSGVPLILIDSGKVERVNVGLQLYEEEDVGLSKCEALACRLRRIRPCAGAEVLRDRCTKTGAANPATVPAGDRLC